MLMINVQSTHIVYIKVVYHDGFDACLVIISFYLNARIHLSSISKHLSSIFKHLSNTHSMSQQDSNFINLVQLKLCTLLSNHL